MTRQLIEQDKQLKGQNTRLDAIALKLGELDSKIDEVLKRLPKA